ncbi:hypothetical protein L226DRAFT_560773 [Lentinus tigrinus ALCF2SS1-7]|uniref:Fungal-type protein kinase domain-containing protein n=1 Tax=Lentinus tigrinus ALCF2SS1-6 TaxID=1328759 RepID=A0A5C2SG53_9APHY|nr:hypothetical protein L227DRAFT_50930 [Lentinus tigrinus ALCF2SS1-6]RPD74648.1 hypothetical protein L226DRAFT_560773 [Lentinus tigrinus ALCF2SS1-7]
MELCADSLRMYPDAQLVMCAAERLACLPCVTHHIDMLIRDDVLWLFWCDRQGVIRSTGISIVRNAPYFLLVLLAMQRFNAIDWGIPESFPDNAPRDEFTLLPGASPLSADITVNWSAVIHHTFQLSGRSTRVFQGKGGSSMLAVKISHCERARLTEDEIVKLALGVTLSTTFPLKDHLPAFVYGRNLDYDSGWIREFVQSPGGDLSASCAPRLTVWEMLQPIHHLAASDFVRCWLEIVHTHRLLWQEGICHLDPSLGNTMVRMVNGTYRGVLNDWDLAHVRGKSKGDGSERIGTRVFMAIDLLCAKGSDPVERRYRHDLEAFVWILVWVFLTYDRDNVAHKVRTTSRWMSPSVGEVVDAKQLFLLGIDRCNPQPQEKWKGHWGLVRLMRHMFAELVLTPEMQRTHRQAVSPEPSDEDVYVAFWAKVDEHYMSLGDEGLQELIATRKYPGLLPPVL